MIRARIEKFGLSENIYISSVKRPASKINLLISSFKDSSSYAPNGVVFWIKATLSVIDVANCNLFFSFLTLKMPL